MSNLKILLKNKFQGAKKVLVLGVGSTLRGDDAAGMLVAHKIEQYRKNAKQGKRLKVLFGETAPENFTGDIKRFNPTHLVFVDCAEFKKKPGSVILLDPEVIQGISFSTHSLPLKIMIDYLLKDLTCKVIIIGIQPKNIHFGAPRSAQIMKAVQDISTALKEILKEVL
ncbi:MAG: hydrogenase maturation peptidase HycI [Candidatus Omnitrophica bacterium]|nr:hydrogenase maturation peptidase HycI [Candidatus Omnitrophota bacterium]